MKVVIYTDGGAEPNPGLGGWAAILRYGQHEKVLTGNDPETTNNRMELQAAISALQALNRPSEIEFYTDSEYLRRGITEWIEGWAEKGWQRKGKPIPNVDLWQALWPLTQKHQIEWHWVKGHSGNEFNERVDKLATQARLEITPEKPLDVTRPRLFIRVSCKGNPGPGGWGIVLEEQGETEQLSGSETKTTNNRLELLAVLQGLELLPAGSSLYLFTTSTYLFQGATNWIHNWRARQWHKKDGQPIANQELWQRLDNKMNAYDIEWVNAKGKTDEPGLKEAGQLADAVVRLEMDL